jgi:hypothetical protein
VFVEWPVHHRCFYTVAPLGVPQGLLNERGPYDTVVVAYKSRLRDGEAKMAWNRSSRLGVAAAVLLVTLGVLVGIAQAAPGQPRPPECNQDGRYICITIVDVENVSHSVGAPGATGATDRYTEYTVTVENGGTSTLTNGSAKVDLKDVLIVDDSIVATQGQFVGAPGCTPSGASTAFTCALPNLGASGESVLHFFARTSTNTSADAMLLTVEATFKESGSDSEGPASQADTFKQSNETKLEGDDELSASVYFDDANNVVLTTTPGVGDQSSVFRLPKNDAFSGSELATLEEVSSLVVCPSESGLSCFGQTVRVSAPALFSGAVPANLLTTMALSLVPKGVTEKSLVVHHDGAAILRACTGAIGVKPAASELPCRRVKFDKKASPAIATIDAWDLDQGDWGFS